MCKPDRGPFDKTQALKEIKWDKVFRGEREDGGDKQGLRMLIYFEYKEEEIRRTEGGWKWSEGEPYKEKERF